MFSYFATRNQNIPLGTLTIQELHNQLVSPDREPFITTINIMQKLREETDETVQKKIKGQLPAFTPGAQLDTKDKDAMPAQKNIRLSGFMQVDIDPQDNLNLKDASAIRDKLAQIPYIVMSAISARGKGVWGLLALAEPEKFTEYIDQVAAYFRMARITIDKSKSKNPTELRYFSPDPGAILKSEYKLFPLVKLQSKANLNPVAQQRYANKVGSSLSDLQRWVTETTGYSLTNGQKHYYLFWLSYALRKNGSSEMDVHNTIYTCVLAADRINSNCISGGIAHANSKGIYLPPELLTSPKAIQQTHKEEKNPLLNDSIIRPPIKPDEKHLYFGADGLLYSHVPGLPDLQ
jgi:hypothetical protein